MAQNDIPENCDCQNIIVKEGLVEYLLTGLGKLFTVSLDLKIPDSVAINLVDVTIHSSMKGDFYWPDNTSHRFVVGICHHMIEESIEAGYGKQAFYTSLIEALTRGI